MYYKSYDDVIAEKYFESIRSLEIAALMAMISLSALNLSASIQQFLAGVAVFGFIFAIYVRGHDFRKISKRYTANFKGLHGNIQLTSKAGTLVISLTVLCLIMLGQFDLNSIVSAIGL